MVNHCGSSCFKASHGSTSMCKLLSFFIRVLRRRVSPFWLQLFYFLSLSTLGFWILKVLKPRTDFRPRNLDLFFTSVSSATISSMSTVEMEVFSNPQLIVMTILMFIGGEVFTSMVGLFLRNSEPNQPQKAEHKIGSESPNPEVNFVHKLELGLTTIAESNRLESEESIPDQSQLMYNSVRLLGFVVLGYLLTVNVMGTALVWIYISFVSSAKHVLKNKGLNLFTFAIFTTISTFSNCGFVPTNENMLVFKKNSLLLSILISQILLGNILFPSCLRFSIWVLGKFFKRVESKFILRNTREIGYLHLLPSQHSKYLLGTVLGFILVQFALFCSMEWCSDALSGLNSIVKITGVLFQCVNARHAGESIVDLSTIASAILVLFVIMMYLPPYTSFIPIDKDKRNQEKKRKAKFVENLIFSQLSYLAIFVILICITERKKIKEDPLNFNVLNIVIEVISAYGNVGFTTGYSCERQLKPDGNCVDKWYGFSGTWSDEGKIILIVVMFFGRLKKFNMNGGKAWVLS
ncbi:hypothetical protein SLE2022_149860 [Rubroshorea leprosula]